VIRIRAGLRQVDFLSSKARPTVIVPAESVSEPVAPATPLQTTFEIRACFHLRPLPASVRHAYPDVAKGLLALQASVCLVVSMS